MNRPKSQLQSDKWGRAASTAGPVTEAREGSSDMTNDTESAARIAQLENERDTALAAYGRIAPLLESAARNYHHTTIFGRTIAGEHEGWLRALRATQVMLAGVDVDGAVDSWFDRTMLRDGAA